jgi:hypothetical protein
MTRTNHILTGVLSVQGYLLYTYNTLSPITLINAVKVQNTNILGDFYQTFIFALVFIGGCVFPDIDIRIKAIPHRTILHWPYIYLFIGIIAIFFIITPLIVFTLGCLFHIFTDSFTKMGIPLTPNPFGKKIGFRFFKVGGKIETCLTLVFTGCFFLFFQLLFF